MSISNWLPNFLDEHINESRPDGRPLYAYKCSDEDYEQLKKLVGKMFSSASEGYPSINFPPMFCLFAAEACRRKHSGGPWKWKTVFEEIDEETPNFRQLYIWLEAGLSYWKRPILQTLTDKHQYRVTIACEGGLPLLLLHKESSCLHSYFKQLLRAYHSERVLKECDVTTIAERLASHLPKSLRYRIVYKLGGDLIQQIADLQDKVAEAVDPIAALDKNDPSWRDKLPLPLGDSTTELFLKNLINEARSLTLSKKQKIRWRRLLITHRDKWQIEQRLELPNKFDGAVLQERLNRKKLAPRFRILQKVVQEITPIALLTRLRGENETATYRCDVLKRKGISLHGIKAISGVNLLASDGEHESDLPAPYGDEWGPLPWVFREWDGQWEYLREGSTCCKGDQVMILAPSGGSLEGANGACLHIGSLPDIGRDLWQCRGTVLWTHPQLGICKITCNSQDDNEEILSLYGERLYSWTDSTPIFLGIPSLHSTSADGSHRSLDLPMEWRPYVGGGLDWSDVPESCLGDVWLRYLDTDNTQTFRRRVRIVPEAFRINIEQLGMDQAIGILRLSGVPDCTVSCEEEDSCDFEVEPAGDAVRIHCLADVGIPVDSFTAKLHWSDGRSLKLALPFPQLGAAFTFEGSMLSDGERIPVTRLAAVQAVVQAPSSGQIFELKVTLKSQSYSLNQMWLREPFKVEGDGRGIFHMHRLQERIDSLLALTGELDAWARIKILKPGGQCFARLEVHQFDMELIPDKTNQKVILKEGCIERLENDWQNNISIRMVPLWAPDRESIILEQHTDKAEWGIPETIDPGPWWVLGEDGDWPRFRPLLWNQSGEPKHSDSPLEKIVCLKDPDTRQQMYRKWAEQIAEDPYHSDWGKFFSLLELVRPYPASSLDLFSSIINFPETMVMALLRGRDEYFEAVWSLSSQLPFSWYLLPVTAWRKAGICYFSSQKIALAELNNGDDYVWEDFQKTQDRVTGSRPFFRPICHWLSHIIFPEKSVTDDELEVARHHPNCIENYLIEEELSLQSRHDPEERYPQGPQIMRWTNKLNIPDKFIFKLLAEPFRPVRCAPFVAAHISLDEERYDEELLFELKKIRDFDRDWFDRAYASALSLGLSKNKTT